jgi:FkbM family methyltransferase
VSQIRTLVSYLNRRRLIGRLGLVHQADTVMLGNPYGGYRVPAQLLDEHSICYLAGTGEDISFDLAIIEHFGCEVYAFDPVPRAGAYVARAAADEPRHHFMPVGLWSSDTTLTFHAPAQTGFVSHSATNLQNTGAAFEAPVRSIVSVMRELGHDHIDLLKVSAEGAEFEIVEHVLAAGVAARVLCVEYAQPASLERVLEQGRRLQGAGYQLVGAGQWRQWKLTFARAEERSVAGTVRL